MTQNDQTLQQRVDSFSEEAKFNSDGMSHEARILITRLLSMNKIAVEALEELMAGCGSEVEMTAYNKAQEALKQMSLEQKLGEYANRQDE
jgi:hypothetical protein